MMMKTIRDLIKEAAKSLNIQFEIHFLRSGSELKEHLKASKVAPFLILCDANLPAQNGLDIRKMIVEDKDLRYKSVPFVFWSTNASERQIKDAYDLPAQGFSLRRRHLRVFAKPSILSLIIGRRASVRNRSLVPLDIALPYTCQRGNVNG